MSLENVEVVKRLFDAWARDEFPGPLELLDPDIEYVNPEGAIEPGLRRGLPAFIGAVESLFEGWASWRMEPEYFRAAGDRVAVVLSYRAQARSSGLELQGRESALLTVRGGRLVRYEWFQTPEAAIEALEPAE
jgi:ketosteroid isomerase-like protein